MNVEIGTEAPIFLFWEYLFQIFGILSLQYVSRDEYYFKATFCTCADSFSLLLWIFLLILKIVPVTSFKDPKAEILKLKMLTESRLWFCKIIPEAACDKLILEHFPYSQCEIGTWEHRSITEKGILRRESVGIFQN